MRDGWDYLQAYLRFLGLPQHQRNIVIYSEGEASWPHLGPVLLAALGRVDSHIAYVSSSAADPGLALLHPRLSTHVIGDGHVRTLFFRTLEASLLLMTMPDLNTFHIKRSERTSHYAYLHHSLVSSHMAYRDAAFDHFDTILCAGPHHETEIRGVEALHQQPAKQLVQHGYGRLDSILAASHDDLRTPDSPVLLVAPSWGPQGLLETHADELLRALARTRWEIIVRPHPQTFRLAPQAINCVVQWCEHSPNMRLETSVVNHDSLRRASAMVSDWSGAAFDYALGLERPVLFIDVPRKVNNACYQKLPLEPIEVFGREHLGRVISVAQLAEIPLYLDQLLVGQAMHRDQIRAFRERWVFNVGKSAAAAVNWLVQVTRQP